MEARIKATVEFTVGESGLEDAMEEYDELTVEGLLREMLDKAIAVDDISIVLNDGPNTLEELDKLSGE